MSEAELKNKIEYKKIFEIADEAIAITKIDKDYNISEIIEANPATVKIFGYTKQELLTKHIFDFQTEETLEEKINVMNQKKEILLKNKEINFEMNSRHKNGKDLYLKVKSILIEGEFTYIVHIIRDITEKKEFENNLKASQKRFRIMFENTPIATCYEDYTLIFRYFNKLKEKNIKNLNFFLNKHPDELIKFTKLLKIIDLNKAAISLYEAASKEQLLAGSNPVNLLLDTFKKTLINLWNRSESGEFDTVIETFKENKKNVTINYKRLPESMDKRIYYLLTLKDITEKKKIENARIRNHSLNALGEMASSVAHDFNNSLQAILGNLESIIYDNTISKENLKILKTIKQVTLDAANRVKIVKRFKNKNENSNYILLSLETLIDDVITQTKPIWKDESEKKGISVSIIRNYNNIPGILGDNAELRSVIYNILKNSIEAMPGGGEITFTTLKSEGNIELIITDTGTGMTTEVKEKIFQPFYTTKGFELGRGLGMSGAYNIIKEHNGNIQVLETGNTGTKIKITLPVSLKNNIPAAILKDNSENKIYNKKQLKILWVDDEEMIRDVALKYISLMGHTGDTAKDGIEALSFLDKNKYDLIITDIGMPNMNGWQLIREIRKNFSDNIKIVVVTGWGSNVKNDSSADDLPYASLQKPIQINDLKKIIDSI